ncbi:EscR/YscR/HrcR family type III secretion system export apparatus protein [Erwiniaceae bacterium BAC15a-03b]|uniref:EscR/YscR/HrcR family type III secretion system export apparatus protein n=1 Tax=Winslowiella arboricola TaxID=2978220 RepID=A0A9J6PPX6_9GAMM|nr:EscR/YscR/HrcR family type III secretion system export apparatus protein [Winslowiella arboricola]MCU5773762.1 EscR/YscR/HrcR family type III secretion system export apparatus protein [Winslowiella arboricola]MCU5777672.1 EscR/YscR/HrcR family type III secretion system export apparatus protein [Winslowiella arboricola]
MENDISLIAVLTLASLAPFLIACGTCYIKFSIVFVMVRNAIGLQQIPSNITLNSVAFVLSVFVMTPVMKEGYNHFKNQPIDLSSAETIESWLDSGFDGYKHYLQKYSDRDLALFFEQAQRQRDGDFGDEDETPTLSLFALLPAYALTEIKEAFKIGFYIYLPFVVIDLLISSILLTLGMMMMSPVTISVPIKLLLFVVMDGWTLISKGLLQQYLDIGAVGVIN